MHRYLGKCPGANCGRFGTRLERPRICVLS